MTQIQNIFSKNLKSNYSILIVGRTNVGKSTLLNVLTNKRISITHKEENTTRDYVSFNYNNFSITDSAGIIKNFFSSKKKNNLNFKIYNDLKILISKSDLILFVVDAIYGIASLDYCIADILRKCGKIIFLIVNKVDNDKILKFSYNDFFKLGFRNIFFISCIHRIGINKIIKSIHNQSNNINKLDILKENNNKFISISIIGYPNVGKSLIFNKLIGYDRTISEDFFGTTRDIITVKYDFNINNQVIYSMISDTPGIRSKRKLNTLIEKFGLSRVENIIFQSDIIILVIQPKLEDIVFDKYNTKIAKLIYDNNKYCIIIINNYNFCITDNDLFKKKLMNSIKFMHCFTPIIFMKDISIVEDYYLTHVKIEIARIYNNFDKINNIKRAELDKFVLKKLTKEYLEKSFIRIYKQCDIIPKVYYIKIIKNNNFIPELVFFVNNTKFFYKKYALQIEKQLMQYFQIDDIPIRLRFKKS